MEQLDGTGTIQFAETSTSNAEMLTTDWLFGDARGKMFGVLAGRNRQGEECVCYAFSGQYRGAWSVPGWVEPLFDPLAFERLTREREAAIKALTKELADPNSADEQYRRIKKERKQLSQSLMQEIHALYELRNFRGQRLPLVEVFPSGSAPPTGTGDCCAPKLIHHAVFNNIIPEGLVEFYWGRQNRSGTRLHGRYYPPCREKCMPILGFLLCGLEEESR